MSSARKIFIGRVTVPAAAATSLYALMRDSPLHWGYETTALTDLSLDSITGSNAMITPDSPVKIGSDATTVAASGIAIATAATYSLQDFGDDFGVIDPTTIFFFSGSGSGMAVTFTAR